jgi:iron(III) transport system substrate-binding protein
VSVKAERFAGLLILSLLSIAGWGAQASAAPLDDLVAAARKEGAINFHAPSAIGPEAAQELGAAFNKKYGLTIKMNYLATKGFTPDVARVVSQSAMGVAPEWDLMVLTEDLHADLWRRGLLQSYDYRSLGMDARAVQHDNHSVAIVHGILLPAYNNKAVAARDVPGTWEDILDPKWKDGKLGISDARYFALVGAGPWGEQKTTEFVKRLAQQKPLLGRLAELYTRLQLGEIVVAPMLPDNFIQRAKATGAPIIHAERVEPVLILPYNLGVLKGAAHPNVAHLFTNFMVTPEAQKIWDKYSGQSSAFVPGTRTFNFVKGKQTVFMGGQNPALVERLAAEYGKILGFTK